MQDHVDAFLRTTAYTSHDGTEEGYAVVAGWGLHRVELIKFPALPTMKFSFGYVRDFVQARLRADSYREKLHAEQLT